MDSEVRLWQAYLMWPDYPYLLKQGRHTAYFIFMIFYILVYESNQDKKSKNLDDFFLPQNQLESLIWVIERFPKNILFFFLVSNFYFRAF